MSLWLCLRFPRLSLESLSRDDQYPLVIMEKQRVIAASDTALAAGVRMGQSGSTVRALITDNTLKLLERDTEAERRTLMQLELWAYSLTPSLERWQDNALQLEIGSCLQLHGGLDRLLNHVKHALDQRGFYSLLGAAPNRPAAWLMSHREDALALDISQPLSRRLAALPISLIPAENKHGFAKAVNSLEKAGIDNFERLLALPSSAIGRRCGKGFQDWLARVTADSDDVHRDFTPPACFYDALWFGFDVRNSTELEPAMEKLLTVFGQFLTTTQLSTSELEWQLLRHRGEPQRLTIRSSEPHRDTQRWLGLSKLQLEQLKIGDDIEGLALNVQTLSPVQPPPQDLFRQSQSAEPLHNLVDRLRSRLGLLAVNQVSLREAHLPEHCQCLSRQAVDNTPVLINQAQRPFWLMSEPQPIHEQNGMLSWNGPLEVIHGPERIEDNWWQTPISRDYYIALRADGQPIWLFQDRHSQRWYVQGIMP